MTTPPDDRPGATPNEPPDGPVDGPPGEPSNGPLGDSADAARERDADDASTFGGRVGDQLRAREGAGPHGAAPEDATREGATPEDADDRRRDPNSARRTTDLGASDRRAGQRRARARREGDDAAAAAESTLARMLRLNLDASSAVPPTRQLSEPPDAGGSDVMPLVTPVDPLYFPLTPAQASLLVREALHEDEAFNDVTTLATVLSGRHARGQLVARQAGVIAGLTLAVEAFRQVDPRVTVRIDVPDGVEVAAGTPIVFLSGHARGILSAERVALNFVQRLSGVATLTARYVHAVAGTSTRILDTRKTTPGWRRLEKYAVRAGGGVNHRMDLAAAVLIKDNHLAAVDGDVGFAVRRAREMAPPGAAVEVECDRRGQVEAALAAGADIVLLDNMSLDDMRACAQLCRGKAVTEASGGVRLDTVRAIAETGVDFISVGALTHSAPAMDLALDFE